MVGLQLLRGRYRSRVAINADLPHRLSHLPHLVAHEAYPGHHTEHCRKELGLVERAARSEDTVFLVNTPECLMAEGLADLGVQASIGEGWVRGRRRSSATSGCASTDTSPSGSRRRPPR